MTNLTVIATILYMSWLYSTVGKQIRQFNYLGMVSRVSWLRTYDTWCRNLMNSKYTFLPYVVTMNDDLLLLNNRRVNNNKIPGRNATSGAEPYDKGVRCFWRTVNCAVPMLNWLCRILTVWIRLYTIYCPCDESYPTHCWLTLKMQCFSLQGFKCKLSLLCFHQISFLLFCTVCFPGLYTFAYYIILVASKYISVYRIEVAPTLLPALVFAFLMTK